MTPDELRALGMARYGIDWQAPLARALDINSRTLRRMLAGDMPISASIEHDILRALGGTEIADPDWPRDTWIVGDARDDLGARREYVMRTRRPRFVARVVALTEDGEPEAAELPADIATGIVYASADYVLAELTWLDPPPPIAEIHRLLEAAADAVDQSAD